MVTASKDGKIIIWDWKECQIVDTINDHRDTVNNIKFFDLNIPKATDKKYSPDQLYDDVSVLVSCSDDGTIRIYDEIAFLTQKNAAQIETQRVS